METEITDKPNTPASGLHEPTCSAAYWTAVGKLGESLAASLARTDRGQAFARLELAARLKDVTQLLTNNMQPKYKKSQNVNTPCGSGKITDAYKHALDPESPPQAWMYRVEITNDGYRGINPATFQESEISLPNATGYATADNSQPT
jgi:hypothetical protein